MTTPRMMEIPKDVPVTLEEVQTGLYDLLGTDLGVSILAGYLDSGMQRGRRRPIVKGESCWQVMLRISTSRQVDRE